VQTTFNLNDCLMMTVFMHHIKLLQRSYSYITANTAQKHASLSNIT